MSAVWSDRITTSRIPAYEFPINKPIRMQLGQSYQLIVLDLKHLHYHLESGKFFNVFFSFVIRWMELEPLSSRKKWNGSFYISINWLEMSIRNYFIHLMVKNIWNYLKNIQQIYWGHWLHTSDNMVCRSTRCHVWIYLHLFRNYYGRKIDLIGKLQCTSTIN